MFQDSEIGAITTGGPFGHPPPSKYEKLISLASHDEGFPSRVGRISSSFGLESSILAGESSSRLSVAAQARNHTALTTGG